MGLDVKTTGWLYKAITQIEAQEMLKQFEISIYPHLKSKEDRNRIFKKYKRMAYPSVKRENISTAEMANELKRMLG